MSLYSEINPLSSVSALGQCPKCTKTDKQEQFDHCGLSCIQHSSMRFKTIN